MHCSKQCSEAAEVALRSSRSLSVKQLPPALSRARQSELSPCSVLWSCALTQPIASAAAMCSRGGRRGQFTPIAYEK